MGNISQKKSNALFGFQAKQKQEKKNIGTNQHIMHKRNRRKKTHIK